jgi:hypothetical protein
MKLEGFTTRLRHAVVFDTKEAIPASGGFTLDHQRFSNRLLRLTVEIRRNGTIPVDLSILLSGDHRSRRRTHAGARQPIHRPDIR